MLRFGLEDWILWSRGQMTQVLRERKDCEVSRLA